MHKYETGVLDDDVAAADTLRVYEARIAALERLVGWQALELEFSNRALSQGLLPRSGPTSVTPARQPLRH